jgi:GntR family transcriptional repressor for pyruvate dehydrogenase complex
VCTLPRSKPSKTDFLYEQISGRIMSGAYQPNTRIPPEEDLAREFGLSRPVVRNALARLKREGVLGSRRGSGTVVRDSDGTRRHNFAPVESIEDVWQCLEFRIKFEGGASALAAERRDDGDLVAIAAALEKLRVFESTDLIATVELDIAFHQTVVAATHNRFVIGTYDTWLPQIRFSCSLSANLSQSRSAQRQEQIVHGHDAILRAIERGDPDASREAMVAHLEAVRMTVFTGHFVDALDSPPKPPSRVGSPVFR